MRLLAAVRQSMPPVARQPGQARLNRDYAVAQRAERRETEAMEKLQDRRTKLVEELASLDAAVSDGLVSRAADGSLEVLPAGRLLVRNVAMVFDAYLPAQRSEGRPLFSKTV